MATPPPTPNPTSTFILAVSLPILCACVRGTATVTGQLSFCVSPNKNYLHYHHITAILQLTVAPLLGYCNRMLCETVGLYFADFKMDSIPHPQPLQQLQYRREISILLKAFVIA